MRKILCFAAVLFTACACSKDDVINVKGHAAFTAVIEDENLTKTEIGGKDSDGTFPILWSEDDLITVFNVSTDPTNSKMTLSSGEGTKEASFSGNYVQSEEGYFAIYPYFSNGLLSSYSDQAVKASLPWRGYTQVAHSGTWDPSMAIMLAYAKEENEKVALSFKNIFAYLKFTTDYPCKSVTFASNSTSDAVSCRDITATYNILDGTASVTEASVSINSVTLEAGESGVIEPGTYYIAVLPCDLKSGFTMTFQSATSDAKTCTRKSSKRANFQKGHVLNLGTLNISTDLPEFAGSGTESDPYQVSNLQELKLVASRTNGGVSGFENPYYIQTADIDCSGETLTPIGNNQYMFAGKYNGNGKTIKNAVFGHFRSDDMAASGLFGNLYNAYIHDLKIENCTVKDYGDSNNPQIVFGFVAAHAYSSNTGKCTITNCTTSCSQTFNSNGDDRGAYQVGGIVGASNANMKISYCTNNSSFNKFELQSLDDPSMGGILGYAGPAKLKPEVPIIPMHWLK